MRELLEGYKQSIIDAVPASSPGLYLAGLQGRGATLIDRSANVNNGTISGATWARLPSDLWVLSFSADDKVTVGHDDSIDNHFDAGGSVEFWIKPDSTTANGDVPICKTWLCYLNAPAAGVTQLTFFYDFTGNDLYYNPTAKLTIGAWNHVLITMADTDPGTVPITTINGTTGGAEVQASTLVRASNAAVDLILGNRTDLTKPFDGDLALVRIYKSVVSGHYTRERHLFGV